jgi:hypothetical protein
VRKLAELRFLGKNALFYTWFLDTSFLALHRTTLVLVANNPTIPIPNSSDKTNIPTIPNSNPTVDVNPKATISLYKT